MGETAPGPIVALFSSEQAKTHPGLHLEIIHVMGNPGTKTGKSTDPFPFGKGRDSGKMLSPYF